MSIFNVLSSNFILDADSYKVSHWKQYPKDTKFLFSAITPRKAYKSESVHITEVVVFGAQMIAKMLDNIRITEEMIDEAEIEITEQGYEFPRELWEELVGKKLPLRVKAVKDGTIVPTGNPIMTIENTKSGFFWLVSYIETWVQRLLWKATTTASVSRSIKQILANGLKETSNSLDGLDYMLHNFGDRSSNGDTGAALIPGMSHLTSFHGTDCLQANRFIKKFYNTTSPAGSSVDASEHSTMCASADSVKRCDLESARMMIEQAEQNVNRLGWCITSVVIDTYNDERFIKEYIGETELKDRIINLGGRVVFRPDSGNPVTKPAEVVEWLMDIFGYTYNDKNFKVLPDYVRVIQGDGVDFDYFPKVIEEFKRRNLSLENVVFGMGSGLTHGFGRDTFSFAMKATAKHDGVQWSDLFKDPITDSGKRSQKGRVTTYKDSVGNIFTERDNLTDYRTDVVDLLELIYNDGICNETTFEEVRERCKL